jgi:hypothetical protein
MVNFKQILLWWFIIFGAVMMTASQEVNDALQINPPECGLLQSSNNKRIQKASDSDQAKWAWQVFLSGKTQAGTGSLINSQWVLTRAQFNEYFFLD